MALKMDTTLPNLTVVVPGAYIRIEQANCSRLGSVVECVARAYESDPGLPPMKPAFRDFFFNAPYDLTKGDPFAQGYAGAKTLPEFAGAIDC